MVDKHVVGNEIREPGGVYIVGELGQDTKPEDWNEEKTRNETDIIKTRIKKTIEQELEGDPFAQKVFSELLKEAIEEAEALFDHPIKQYALFKSFEEKLDNREIENIPEKLKSNAHARSYYGTFHLVMGEDYFKTLGNDEIDKLAEEALAIDRIVDQAVAEHSLNTSNIEAAINKGLLPRLFKIIGMDKAKEVIEQIIHITRVGISGDRSDNSLG